MNRTSNQIKLWDSLLFQVPQSLETTALYLANTTPPLPPVEPPSFLIRTWKHRQHRATLKKDCYKSCLFCAWRPFTCNGSPTQPIYEIYRKQSKKSYTLQTDLARWLISRLCFTSVNQVLKYEHSVFTTGPT